MLRGIGLCAVIGATTLAACSDDPSLLNGNRRSGTSSSGASTSGTSGDTTSSSGDPATTPSGSTPAEICVAAINEYRKTKSLPPYARWDGAETCTDGQAESDGSTQKPHGAFGKCGESAQNECPGWPGPPATMIAPCLKTMFGEGPGGGHYEAIMATQYTKVSCGFGTAPNGQIWAVQNFR
jgi:hypothetical protein